MKTKAISYCRVSSKEQEETGYSLEAQEKLLEEYAEKNDFQIAKTFKVTESASKWQIRKTLGEMLVYAEKNGIKVIFCEKIDRLTRSLKDAATVDDWVHNKDEREVHFVKEHFVLNENTKAHENFVWDMKVAVARFYTNNLSEEVKKGQKAKLAAGWLPTKPPLGFRTVGDKGHKTHVIDEDKAAYVQRMFELCASGSYSIMAIRDKLYEEGLRTRGGVKLAKSRIAEMLRDPFYYGAMRWNDVVYGNGAHEPLVSKEVFDKVNDILAGKKAPAFKRRFFQFRKMITCGECAGSVTAEIKKGQYIYYHCNHYRNCSQKANTQEKEIESQLFGVFKFFESITPEEAEELKNRIKKNHAQEIEYKESTIKSLNERYSMLQKRLDRLYDDHLDGTISRDLWQRKQKEITDEQAEALNQLGRLKSEEAKYFEIWLNIIDLARHAREIYEKRNPEERRMLLSHLFSMLKLKDSKVEKTYKASTARIAQRVQEKLDAERLEQVENASKSVVSQGVSAVPSSNDLVGDPGASKQFRTSKNRSVKPQHGRTAPISRPLLRG